MTACEHVFLNPNDWPGQWARCLRCEEMARRPFMTESNEVHHAECPPGKPCRWGGSSPPQPCKAALKISEFYAEKPERKASGEADYGVWWTDGPSFPRYRVSYIQRTGEVYAFNQSTNEVQVLGIVPPDVDEGFSPDVAVYYRTLDRILEGWADSDISKHELAWVRAQLAFAGVTA